LLFPFAEYWWAYVAFTLFIGLLLALDLYVFNRSPHEVSLKEATVWTVVWTVVAMVFNWVLWAYSLTKFPEAVAKQAALEFAAGYVVERALSFDNIFVFVVVFRFFGIPGSLQHRVLFYGILGAFIFRGIFIALGALLMKFHFVVVIFGILLIYTGLKMLKGGDEHIDPSTNPVLRMLQRWLPVTPRLQGGRFFTRINGVRYATPLFICVVFLEMTDVVFAIDSVPAVFALTKEPLLVFQSNIFAILGLRAMYFMLAGAMDKFYLLKYGLSFVLVFVGLKMTVFDGRLLPHISIGWSLAIILSVLAISITASLLYVPDRHKRRPQTHHEVK
jgi:tellurite resistance protein TerC